MAHAAEYRMCAPARTSTDWSLFTSSSVYRRSTDKTIMAAAWTYRGLMGWWGEVRLKIKKIINIF